MTSRKPSMTSPESLMTSRKSSMTSPKSLMTSPKSLMTSPKSSMTSPKSLMTSPKSSTTSPKSLTTSPTPGESDDCHELPPAKAFDPSDEPIRPEGGVVERAVVAARGDADDLVTAPLDAHDAMRGQPPLEPRQHDVAATQRARIDGFDDELLPGADEGVHAVAGRREAGAVAIGQQFSNDVFDGRTLSAPTGRGARRAPFHFAASTTL